MNLLTIDCSKLLGFRLSGSASAAKAGVKAGVKLATAASGTGH